MNSVYKHLKHGIRALFSTQREWSLAVESTIMVVTEEWAYIWALKEWLWNLRQIALFFQTSLILKMEMIIPNNRVSVSIAVLSTLNMARDSPMVLTVVSLSSYSCNVQERTHFSLKCFFLFPFSSLKVTTLSFPVSFLLSCVLLMGSCVVYSTEWEASNLGSAAS